MRNIHFESVFTFAAGCMSKLRSWQISGVPQPCFSLHLIRSIWSVKCFPNPKSWGGFQLIDVIIMELKRHMTCYISMPLIGWNYSIQTGEKILWRIFLANEISTNELEFLTGHVTFKLRYNQIYYITENARGWMLTFVFFHILSPNAMP